MNSAKPVNPNSVPASPLYLVLLTLITACTCAWVLSLPLFPSQDGPIHLFYTSILHDLLFHTSPLYARFYTIKHLLPPYSLYYYLLMALSRLVSILTADKLVICLYIVSFAFGMRFLASSIGSNGDIAALLATPLLLNWPLAMGFVNFCLSASFALWAMGLWVRSSQRDFTRQPDFASQPGTPTRPGTGVSQSHPRKIAFVLLAVAITLTHPVPLLFLLGFCALDLALRARTSSLRSLRTDLFYLALASSTLLYVRLFTASHILAQHVAPHPETRLHKLHADLLNYLLLRSLSLFGGSSPLDLLHRLSLILILLTGLFFAARQLLARRGRPWSLSDTWASIALTLAVLMPFIPDDLNHSHFFAYRLVLFVWIAALLALSGARIPDALRPVAAAFSLVAAALVLILAQSRISPVARSIASIETQPALPFSRVGLLLLSPDHARPGNLSFDPYLWSGAHLFRRTGSVLYDSPWLDLAIIPIGPQPVMPTASTDPEDLEELVYLRHLLDSSPAARTRFLTQSSFAVVVNGAAPPAPSPDPLLEGWTCRPYTWFSLCPTSAPVAAP